MKRNKILVELEHIASENGGMLRPADVVEYARDPSTTLHSQFEWDDTEAAAQYRIAQARYVIRVNVTVLPGQTAPVRAWVSLRDDRHAEGGYRTLVSVLSDEAARERMLAEALLDLQAWQNKYRRLSELAPIFEAARGVQRRRGRKRKTG